MIIYENTRSGFVDDIDQNLLRTKLESAFLSKTGSIPSDRSVWAAEYAQFSGPFRKAKIDDDVQIAIEYHVSSIGRNRIDVLLAGSDGKTDNGLIIELKAWDRAATSEVENMVIAPYGGGKPSQHPCLQAIKYKGTIVRFNEDVVEKGIQFHPSAYLMNLNRRNPEPLEDSRYSDLFKDSRLFLADDTTKLREYIEEFVPKKAKNNILFILDQGRWRPSDELLTRVDSMLDGNEEFDLQDEQDEAFRLIRHQLLDLKDRTHRHVFVVEGGPGTGKSVIAVRLLAEVLKKKRMAFLVAPNKAYRDAILHSLSRGSRAYREDGDELFKSSWSFHRSDFRKDERSEVLIVDEAHRLKDKAYRYEGKSMVEDMVRSARISIFFIDESQKVSWNDTGSVASIRAAAKQHNAAFHEPFQLSAQFRCNGSSGYLNWLDDVLQVRDTGNFDNWGDGQYEFRVFEKADDLYSALKKKNLDNKARLIAGYSWEWPSEGRQRGTNLKHVQADGLSLPWNYHGESWAAATDGIEQVGCIHTIQGLEFDWLGVLIGGDLISRQDVVSGNPLKRARTDKSLHGWKSDLKKAKGDVAAEEAVMRKVDQIIKSTYRVLLSRGRKGTFVWCEDKALSAYLLARLELAKASSAEIAPLQYDVPIEILPTYSPGLTPLYSLEAAAGSFSENQVPEQLGWVRVDKDKKPSEGDFVAKVIGRSMEPTIKNGSYCLFRRGVAGSRGGKVVLAQSNSISDPETGGHYTVKRYSSKKTSVGEADWRHLEITLLPDNKEFDAIPIPKDSSSEFRIIAEFIKTISQPRP